MTPSEAPFGMGHWVAGKQREAETQMENAIATQEDVLELRLLIEALQAETARLSQVIEASGERAAVQPGCNSDTPSPVAPGGRTVVTENAPIDLSGRRTSRRNMFKAGAVLATAAVASPMLTNSAAAADGSNMVVGASNTSGGGHTRLTSTGTGLLTGQNIMTVTDNSASSSYPSAIGAYGQGERVTNGIYSYAGARDNNDTRTGHAIIARAVSGGRSHLFMPPSGSDPHSDTYAHARGEMRSTSGNLWFCTGSGTPGTWKKLTGTAASGAVHAINPRRAYDSRFIDGQVAAGGSRIVSVANSINVTTGANTGPLVPTGATAVWFNITVVNTTGSGFLSVGPGTATALTSASVNWSEPGQILNNGTMSTVDDSRQLRVFAGGGNANFVVDVTGYTL